MKTEIINKVLKEIDNDGSGVQINLKQLESIINEHEKEYLINGVMPRSLTAENGAKDLLTGEFVECFDPDESGNPYIVPITWGSIKNIYKRIVDHYVG